MATETHSTTPAPAKKSRRGLLITTAVLVLLFGGGGGAYWMFVVRAQGAASGQDQAPAASHEERGVVAFDPFVVNLADAGGGRYLRVTLALIVDSEEHATEIAESPVTLVQTRSAILELLAQETAEHLITPKGKTELKQAIAERVSHSIHEAKVSDVLFSEFIVQ